MIYDITVIVFFIYEIYYYIFEALPFPDIIWEESFNIFLSAALIFALYFLNNYFSHEFSTMFPTYVIFRYCVVEKSLFFLFSFCFAVKATKRTNKQ